MNDLNGPGTVTREIRHFHLFCGLGAGARGFNRGSARVGHTGARLRCLGGIDVDSACVRDFRRLTGVPGTHLDLFDRGQYVAFHGQEPPRDWREATPDDIRRAAGGERPHIVFLSPPCKGFSGLLAEERSKAAKYEALNALTVRGLWLTLEAWTDDPPELVILENVPRIATRGRALLDRIGSLLRAYGYAVAETFHDCGEIGGLAQSRKRFLLVARHQAKVAPFLYEPPKRPLRAVGDVLGRMLLPGDERAGRMHRVPALQWKTWVRLAFVEAGSDWRSLQKLAVVDGVLRDYCLVPERDYFRGALGVLPWTAPSGTIAGESLPLNGTFAVADPRRGEDRAEFGQYGVKRWDEPSQVVIGKAAVGAGHFAVGDPRPADGRFTSRYRVTRFNESAGTVIAASTTGDGAFAVADPAPAGPARFHNVYRTIRWTDPSNTITGGQTTTGGGLAVEDPRHDGPPKHSNEYRIVRWDEAARAVTGAHGSGQCVEDPRWGKPEGDAFQNGGHYGVLRWDEPSGAVAAASCWDNGRFSVADPRPALPAPNDRLVCVIRSLDGTWHRPFTTLELACLQSLVEPEEALELDGLSDAAWRERIGNAVPPDAATAIANEMAETLLLAWAGEGFSLSLKPIWVRPISVALSVRQPGDA